MTEHAPLIRVENLRVAFDTHAGKVQAVRGVSFHLNPSETVAIVGESGSGKSVTAHSIMRLVPTPPGILEEGQILFEGQNLLTLDERSMRAIRGSRIGMVFQDPMTSLNPTLTIGYQLAEMLYQHEKLSHAEVKARCLELLQLVGLPHPEERLKHYPHQFSGGQRQRIMIAMGLACSPKLLIADEPTTALDVTIQAQILDLIRSLQKKMKMSLLLITHDLGVVAGMADRIMVMYGGQIVESGSVDQIFYKPIHPYTKALLNALPHRHDGSRQKLKPIEGSPPDLLHPPQGCSFCPRCPYAMTLCATVPPPLIPVAGGHSRCHLHHPEAKYLRERFYASF